MLYNGVAGTNEMIGNTEQNEKCSKGNRSIPPMFDFNDDETTTRFHCEYTGH